MATEHWEQGGADDLGRGDAAGAVVEAEQLGDKRIGDGRIADDQPAGLCRTFGCLTGDVGAAADAPLEETFGGEIGQGF